jgi:metallophosphoesterase (TIGR03768 family)
MNNQDNEQTKSGEVTRRVFIKYAAGTVVCISLSPMLFGCDGSNSKARVESYPIDSRVVTTAEETVKLSQNFSGTIDPLNLKNISDYDQYGYGVWIDGGQLAAVVRDDIMADGYTYPAAGGQRKLLRFFAITDIHIIDKESPSQLIYLQHAKNADGTAVSPMATTNTSIYSPTMLYSIHVLDAVIQTVNALHRQNPIDFGISLGDACNSAQYNELRWYIDVIDGEVITPSSGANLGAGTIDYQKPFKAVGLDPAIPWYQTIGNHDHFWLGSLPFNAKGLDMRGTPTSKEVLAMIDAIENAGNLYNTDTDYYYMGVIDGSTPHGTVIKGGKVGDPGFTSPPKVAPDRDRRVLTRSQWIQEFFVSTSSPHGHGFALVHSGQEEGFACYSFVPKSTIPIKVIVLDDTQREDDGVTSIHGRGFLDQARWDWLKAELAAGDAAGQLMVIAAHIPIAVAPHSSDIGGIDTYLDWLDGSITPTDIDNAVTLPELIEELHNHPNLLMWIAGHRHVNTVKAFVSDDAAKPERGFWQVETCSLHDFPQQFRTFEIKLNSDYTISIEAINVDPAVKEGTPAWTARKYAVAAQQIVKNSPKPNLPNADPSISGYDPSVTKTNDGINPDIGSYNAELLVQLSDEMKTKIQSLFPVL